MTSGSMSFSEQEASVRLEGLPGEMGVDRRLS